MQITGRHYATGALVTVELDKDRIRRIQATDGNDAADSSAAAWLAPGFVDLQINGYGGQEFNDLDLTPDKVSQVTMAQDATGVTSYLPTSTTHSFEVISHGLATIARACDGDRNTSARIAGVHLEGPYLSPEDGPRGAHPREHIRPPDWDEFRRFQDAAGGRIRILTVSPEHEGAAEFIRQVVSSGVVVAIGHTAANSQQIEAAVDAGASMSTHLGNGAHGKIDRHHNYIWDQLADDRLVASLIADGHHLPPAVIKSFVRGKTPERCVLVSDMMGMGGLPPGLYENTSVGAIEILESGRLVVAGQRQYLAGAALPMAYGVANVMRFAGVNLKTAIDMSTGWPAKIISSEAGVLDEGAPADLILFDLPADEEITSPLQIRATIKNGEVVHGEA